MSTQVKLSENDIKTIKKLEQIGKESAEELVEAYKELQKTTRIHLFKRRSKK